MSFSSTVKEELSRQLTTARHCQIAEMAAILSLCGRVKISASDHFAIAIHTENLAVARKYFTLLKKTFNINTDVLIRQGLLPARSRTYVVAVREHEDALRVLQAAKLLDANGDRRRPVFSPQRDRAEHLLQTGVHPGSFSCSRFYQ